MERTKVNSTNIAAIGYEEETSILEVEFKRGGVYQYSGVSIGVHSSLINAESKGKFFAEHIRDSYSFEKL